MVLLDLEFKNNLLRNYLKANYSQNLILKQNFIDQKLKKKSDDKSDLKDPKRDEDKTQNINQKSGMFLDTIKLRNLRQLLTYVLGIKLINTSGRNEVLLKFEITTNRILDESEKLNAKLVFVYLPHLKNPYTFTTSFEKNKVINIIKKNSEETMNKVVKIIVSKL